MVSDHYKQMQYLLLLSICLGTRFLDNLLLTVHTLAFPETLRPVVEFASDQLDLPHLDDFSLIAVYGRQTLEPMGAFDGSCPTHMFVLLFVWMCAQSALEFGL